MAALCYIGSMRNPTLTVTHPSVSKEGLVALASAPRCLDRDQDRGLTPGGGRKTPLLDCRRAWPEPHEPASLDSWGEPRRGGRIVPESPSRVAHPYQQPCAPPTGPTLGAVPPNLWAQSRPVGWPNVGHPPQATVRYPAEGAARAAVDAPIGLSAQTSRV